jgi:beta-lactamase class D
VPAHRRLWHGLVLGLLVAGPACTPKPETTSPAPAAVEGSAVEGSASEGSAVEGSASEGSAVEGGASEGSTAALAEAVAGLEHPGCFMLQRLPDGPPLAGGRQSCSVPTSPASTFKIPHALIALDTGVVTDVDATRPWDGRTYWIESWHRDHSLRTAIYESVVWFFKGTAREIGRARMREYLVALDYGNAKVEGPIDEFWLDDGSLEVTPEQSLRFMTRLYTDALPRGSAHVATLRELLVRPVASLAGRMPEGTPLPRVHPQMVLSAKTGTAGMSEGNVTWLVGHVQCPDHAYTFVSRVIGPGEPQVISPAVSHGLAALDRTGVLRCER